MKIDSWKIKAIAEALNEKDIKGIAEKFAFNKYTVRRILECKWYNHEVIKEALIYATKNIKEDYLLSERAKVLAEILNINIKTSKNGN